MTDEFELLRHFRDEIPSPAPDAWARARLAIAVAAAEEKDALMSSVTMTNRRVRGFASTRFSTLRSPSPSNGLLRPRLLIGLSAVVSAALLVVGLATILSGTSGLSGPLRTQWSVAHALPNSRSHVPASKGTWMLTDYITNKGWQQNTTGPEPGNLTCPTASTCYVTGDNATSSFGPANYDSLYVSNDGALSWSVLPVPTGVDFTTPLSCASAQSCGAGATFNKQPVYISTSDGGHSFTIDPLPASYGTLYSLDCTSSNFCAGLVATSVNVNDAPFDATFLSTTNDGLSFADAALPTGQSMDSLACPTSAECVVVGTSDAHGADALFNGVVAQTSNGGESWTSGALPLGFGIANDPAQISCSDAQHCSILGNIAVAITNPPQCSAVPLMVPPTATSSPPAALAPQQSPAVQAISQEESAYWAKASALESKSGSFSCTSGGGGFGSVSDIAETSDGGLTWVPEALPSSAPEPLLTDIVCASNENCVASGTVAVPQRFSDGAIDGGSAMVMVTNDDGASWNGVVFVAPSNDLAAANSGAFQAVGDVQCPQVNACVALGSSNQGAKTTPVYTGGSDVASSNNA